MGRVEAWLEFTVGHGQYCDNFVNNGFDTIFAIKTIQTTQVLGELGITSNQHQHRIMQYIQKLQEVDNEFEADGPGDIGGTLPATDKQIKNVLLVQEYEQNNNQNQNYSIFRIIIIINLDWVTLSS